jgi:hypothetical protein
MALVNVMKRSRLANRGPVHASALCRMVASYLNSTDLNTRVVRSTPHHIHFSNSGESVKLGEVDGSLEMEEDPPQDDTATTGTEKQHVVVPATTSGETGTRGGDVDSEDANSSKSDVHVTADRNDSDIVDNDWRKSKHRSSNEEPPRLRRRVTGPEEMGLLKSRDSDLGGRAAFEREASSDAEKSETHQRGSPVAKRRKSPRMIQEFGEAMSGSDDDYDGYDSDDDAGLGPHRRIRSNQMRTLHVLGNPTKSESILCRLVVETLPRFGGDWPKYTAISHVWFGEQEEQDKSKWPEMHVVDDDFETRHSFRVPPSFADCVRRLRQPRDKVVLYADIACIDQANIPERVEQMALLPRIFQNAAEVVVWLGEEDRYSNIAMDFVSRVIDLEQFDLLVNSDDTPAQWEALVALMRRRWFTRRWVFQEIILTRTAVLRCGGKAVPWSDFCDVVILLGACFDDVQYRLKRYEISNK